MDNSIAADVWLVWIAVSAGSFLVLEFGSILWRRWLAGTWRHAGRWTLSECVRRWAQMHRWLPVVAVGGMAALIVHLFVQANP